MPGTKDRNPWMTPQTLTPKIQRQSLRVASQIGPGRPPSTNQTLDTHTDPEKAVGRPECLVPLEVGPVLMRVPGRVGNWWHCFCRARDRPLNDGSS
jgi:hypothetical protein